MRRRRHDPLGADDPVCPGCRGIPSYGLYGGGRCSVCQDRGRVTPTQAARFHALVERLDTRRADAEARYAAELAAAAAASTTTPAPVEVEPEVDAMLDDVDVEDDATPLARLEAELRHRGLHPRDVAAALRARGLPGLDQVAAKRDRAAELLLAIDDDDDFRAGLAGAFPEEDDAP